MSYGKDFMNSRSNCALAGGKGIPLIQLNLAKNNFRVKTPTGRFVNNGFRRKKSTTSNKSLLQFQANAAKIKKKSENETAKATSNKDQIKEGIYKGKSEIIMYTDMESDIVHEPPINVVKEVALLKCRPL